MFNTLNFSNENIGAVVMPNSVCVLSSLEAHEFKRGLPLHCRNHHHVKPVEAHQMTKHGDYSPYFEPIAQWIGPRQIEMITTWEIKNLDTVRREIGYGPKFKTQQIVEQGHF